ncbi:hypothetical protein BPT24_093 [Tenacibaculum phage pT24]|uniref:Uncharacterized protein n=1 Tax=Tenacibaculum phage pT24 TaxID=1880590 RepID=A0A1B4XWN1_9CAUD|nr:hypothetical protein HYP10_gp093 [Tenacibaculum phage pT24]BAV39218.1 hypothetical protein BPT24_093 [Tenacibaculum phage pT24]
MISILKTKTGKLTNSEEIELERLIEQVDFKMGELHSNWDEFRKTMNVRVVKNENVFIMSYETQDSYSVFTKYFKGADVELNLSIKSKKFGDTEVYRLSMFGDDIWTDFVDIELKEPFQKIAIARSFTNFLKGCYHYISLTTLKKYE